MLVCIVMKIFLALLALCALSVGGYIYVDIAQQPAAVVVTTFAETNDSDPVAVSTIVRTREGFEPKKIVVEKGTEVRFVNESGEYYWPASDYHPSHTEYSAFDPKRPLNPSEEWSMTFDQVGEWGYHDHLKAKLTGVIYVEDPDEEAFDLEDGQIMDVEVVE